MGQINEAFCEAIAYNLTVLIHEVFEHGAVADFAGEGFAGSPFHPEPMPENSAPCPISGGPGVPSSP